MERSNFIKDGEITAFAEGSLFSEAAILKCLYWFGDRFHTNVLRVESDLFQIKLKPLQNSNIKEDELHFYLQKLERDLIDFQLRDLISEETKNIRDLLVAKAFSNGEFDEDPPGEISDPVGFNPNTID